MIKFFRKIRQDLLMENKTGKYLKYAIGEIVLVVIGILIALQINNWNEGQKQKELEIKYLTEIRNSLESDLPDIEFNIEFNRSKLNSHQVILQYINGELEYSDSLSFHFSNLLFNTRTLINTSAYENLKSRGLEIISNDSLRMSITRLYAFEFHNLVDFETKDDHVFQYSQFLPEITNALKINSLNPNEGFVSGAAEPIDITGIKDDISFKNTLLINLVLRQYMVDNYENLIEMVKDEIQEIEAELQKLN